MKTYELYVKLDCTFCKQAIDLLSMKKIPFVATIVDKDPQYLEKIKEKWSWMTVPIVIENELGETKLVGGFSELQESFNVEPRGD